MLQYPYKKTQSTRSSHHFKWISQLKILHRINKLCFDKHNNLYYKVFYNRCALFGSQELVLMAIRLWASSCCSLGTGSVSWSTASPYRCPPSPTCPGWASLPKVSHGSRLCSFFFSTSWLREGLPCDLSHCRSAGTPCSVDSDGVVRLLNRSLGNTWTPLCNTRETCKSKSDHYWVVGVHENPQQLRWLVALSHHMLVPLLFWRLKWCESLYGGIEKSKTKYNDIFNRYNECPDNTKK